MQYNMLIYGLRQSWALAVFLNIFLESTYFLITYSL